MINWSTMTIAMVVNRVIVHIWWAFVPLIIVSDFKRFAVVNGQLVNHQPYFIPGSGDMSRFSLSENTPVDSPVYQLKGNGKNIHFPLFPPSTIFLWNICLYTNLWLFCNLLSKLHSKMQNNLCEEWNGTRNRFIILNWNKLYYKTMEKWCFVCADFVSILPAFEKNRLTVAWENGTLTLGMKKKKKTENKEPATHTHTPTHKRHILSHSLTLSMSMCECVAKIWTKLHLNSVHSNSNRQRIRDYERLS